MAKEQKATPPAQGVTVPALPPEVAAIIEEHHVETFHNRGFDAPLSNHFRAATEKLKARLAAALALKKE